jgi:hypothetical protein
MKKTFSLAFLVTTFYLSGIGQDLNWAARLGGSSFDQAYAVATDQMGNVYTSGSFEGTSDFNPGSGTANLTSTGDADVFISKLNSSGQFVWAIRFGGTTEDYAEALMTDGNGSLYVIGYFNGTSDFDPGPGTTNLTAAGSYDMYIAKFDLDGVFQWARRIGGTAFDQHRGIALDSTGNIVLTGQFSGTADFDPGVGTLNLFAQGGFDIGIYKLNDAGQLVWAKRFGGGGDDVSRGLAIDKDNNILMTGRFEGIVDFNPGGGTNNLISVGGDDIFILKLDASGNYVWAHRFGSDADEEGLAITSHPDGYMYTTGFFQQTVDFDRGPNTQSLTSAGAEDIYIQKLDGDGNLVWVKQVGGNMLQKAHSMVTDTTGNVYLSGYFSGTMDFDPGPGTESVTSMGGLDAFVMKLNPGGNHLWHARMGGPEDIRSQRMALHPLGDVYAIGYFSGTGDFDPGSGVLNLTDVGELDVFVVSLTNLCQSTSSTISPIVCDQYTSPDGLEIWTQSGTYTDTIPNAEGCDSIITVQLTVNQSSAFSFQATACDAYVSPDGSEIWTSSGIYQDTLPNALGCDSVITIDLTILFSSAVEIVESACDSLTSPGGGLVWTESGIYQDIIPNAQGCDSVITINLTILHSTSATMSATACDAYTLPDGEVVTAPGTYISVVPNAAGCDSVITVQLDLFQSTASQTEVTSCAPYTSPSGDFTWTVSGVYSDVIPNAAGCDSLMTIVLSIPDFNTTVHISLEGTTLQAEMEGVGYQWVNCDNGYQSIPGATSQSFTPEVSGSYAVILSADGCSDTSECAVVMIVATEDPDNASEVRCYPNPSNGVMILETDFKWADGTLTIINAKGQTVQKLTLNGWGKTALNMNEPPGLYLIKLEKNGNSVTKRMVRL